MKLPGSCKKRIKRQLLLTSEFPGRLPGKIARRVVAEKLDGSLLENLRFLGIDEISYGRPRKFLTVVIDHERHRVIWVGEGQSAKTLAGFFELLGPQRCSAIQAVSIDMDLAFEAAIANYIPNDKIVYDRFHIVQCSLAPLMKFDVPKFKRQIHSTRKNSNLHATLC
jgi:transposase